MAQKPSTWLQDGGWLSAPCPYLTHFRDFIETCYGVKVVVGTHPIPQKYLNVHSKLKTWESPEWKEFIQPTVADEKT